VRRLHPDLNGWARCFMLYSPTIKPYCKGLLNCLFSVRKAAMVLVKSLWRGDVPLVRAYWVFGILGPLLLEIPLIIWEKYQPMEAIVTVYTVITILYLAFIVVAVWSSANKYKGWYMWAALAKLGMITNVVSSFRLLWWN